MTRKRHPSFKINKQAKLFGDKEAKQTGKIQPTARNITDHKV